MAMAGPATRADHPGTTGTDDAVLAAQIDLLYGAPAFMLLNPGVALIAAFVLLPLYPNWAVASWIALISLVSFLRFLDRRRYLRSPDRGREARRWGRRFAIGAAITGCLWGSLGSAMLLTPSPEHQAFVFFLLGGLGTAAVVAQAAYSAAFLGFIIPALTPLVVATFARPGTTYPLLALLLVAFTGVLIAMGRTINRWMTDGVRLQIAQSALAGNLEVASAELRRRDAVLRAMVASATELLRTFDLDRSMPAVLKLAGEATGVSRVYLLQISGDAAEASNALAHYEWSAPTITPALTDPARRRNDLEAVGLGHWPQLMKTGEPATAIIRLLDRPARELFERHGVKSILMVPVFVQGTWWGQMGFDDCDTERDWSAVEIDALKTIAELVGAAIGHARSIEELGVAARIVENSSTVLYRLQPKPPYPLTYLSRNAARYGYSAGQFLTQPTAYMDIVHPEDRAKVMSDLVHIAGGPIGEIVEEYRLRLADGSYAWFEGHTRGMFDEKRRLTAIEGLLININERKAAEATITRFELTDQLTGLANRKRFMEHLTHAFIAARRGAAPFALLYLDLDYFKDINDVHGHSKGDELLKAVANRLKEVPRAHDIVARFGGDEFAVLQTDAPDPSIAGTLATRILQALSAPYNLGIDIHVTASIGIAVYDPDASGPEELIKRADLALYRAKDAGRNQYHFHSDALDIEVRERVTLGEDLRVALDRRELELYYQPQVEVPSVLINGVEALVRWNHPTRGLMLPGRFIPVAEKTGLIVPLGLWIVDIVCRQIARWQKEMPRLPPIAINLSAAQLRPSLDFDREYAAILQSHGIDAGAIELELTESVLMQATRENSQMIERLRALGSPIAIDDFGTGYSSLEYLRAYRVSHIKIAQEFIRNLDTDPGDAAIVRATISLARELGIKVIAEGVETAAQLDALLKAGCESVQGHYFSEAVPASEVVKLLRKRRLEPALPHRGKTPDTDGPAPARMVGGQTRHRAGRT